jgi:Acetylornithine deacetylase/Succinyl-diaminopimelate desuccinylase and related deacylases
MRFLACFLSLIVLTTYSSKAGAIRPIPDPLELTQRLIRLDTTNPPGNESLAARDIQALLRQHQIESEIFESAPGRGNLVARLKGSGKKAPLLLLGHLDVVTADPKEWSHPPFVAEVADGYLYGRGALDMKGMVALEILTLLRIKTEKAELERDLILLLSADEEAGGKYGAQFMTEQHWDKIEAQYVMSEGSVGLLRDNLHLYPIQVAEKGVAWMELTAHGSSGHGAMPIPDNPVAKLVTGLHRLTARPQPIQKTKIVETFLGRLAEKFSFPKSFVLRHFFAWPISWLAPALAGSRIEGEKILNAMLRNTLTPTVLSAGSKTNVIPAEARAEVDGRILPGTTPEDFKRLVESQLEGLGIEVRFLTQSAPSESPFDTPFFNALEGAILAQDPDAIVVPYLSPGGTDNRFFRKKGVVSYGLIPLLLDSKDLAGLHGKDERIKVDQLKRGARILYDLVLRAQAIP